MRQDNCWQIFCMCGATCCMCIERKSLHPKDFVVSNGIVLGNLPDAFPQWFTCFWPYDVGPLHWTTSENIILIHSCIQLKRCRTFECTVQFKAVWNIGSWAIGSRNRSCIACPNHCHICHTNAFRKMVVRRCSFLSLCVKLLLYFNPTRKSGQFDQISHSRPVVFTQLSIN